MNIPHFQYSAVYLILRDEQDRVLLQRRFNTGFMDGYYSLVAGHVEWGESATDAVLRESREEIGVVLRADDCTFVHVMHRRSADRIYYDFFFEARAWNGAVRIVEPHKCDDLTWFSRAALPINIVPYVRDVLLNWAPSGVRYSEVGF
jgi:ADP-ribose pyrophosphatase YjhB (NUDIX family)